MSAEPWRYAPEFVITGIILFLWHLGIGAPNMTPIICASAILITCMIAFMIGTEFFSIQDALSAIKTTEETAPFKRRAQNLESRTKIYRFFVSIVASLYVAAYFHFITQTYAPADVAVYGWITAITAISIGSTVFFARGTAAYTINSFRLENDLIMRGETVIQLNEKVASGSHLFEPAGNIFVLVGIATTFTSLTVGLVTLDPDAISAGQSGTLIRFATCTGLALGVSMLGVVTAILSQFIRGAGAICNIDDLLANTGCGAINPALGASTTSISGGSTVTSVPASVPVAANSETGASPGG